MILDTNMRYAFFGSPRFAEIILEKLIAAGMPPAVVVCNPDKPVGRKQIITPPPVKASIMRQASSIKDAIKILQPETKEDLKNTNYLLHDADFAVVAAYAKIIPQSVIGQFRLGMIGLHPSLLPKYRGTTPIQTAILESTPETGVTAFLIDENVDHGGIVASSKYQASSTDTYETLEKKLAELGGDLLVKLLPKFAKGGIKPQTQDESQATYTKKFLMQDGFAEWETLERAQNEGGDIAQKLDRKIRAFGHEPGVWTLKPDSKRMKLLGAMLSPDGKLVLKKIQIEGKREQEL